MALSSSAAAGSLALVSPASDAAGQRAARSEPALFRKIFLFRAMLRLVEGAVSGAAGNQSAPAAAALSTQGGPGPQSPQSLQQVLEATRLLQAQSDSVLDASIAHFSARFSTPLPGRLWRWEFVLTQWAPQAVREATTRLIDFTAPDQSFQLLPRRVFETETEKRLWAWLQHQQ